MSSLLIARNITKNFGPIVALDNVDFELDAGEIHALMGENGAGKSTLIKILSGAETPDSGVIELQNKPVDPKSPREARLLGISTVYQEINLIPTMSIADNIVLGRHPMKFGRIDRNAAFETARKALARLRHPSIAPAAEGRAHAATPPAVESFVHQLLGECSIAVQQLVAIARALDFNAKVLILDEPTSSLDRGEVTTLFTILKQLKGAGIGIIFITHFLEQVYEIADRITVLRNGKLVGTHETAQLPRLKLVAEMLGRTEREITEAAPTRAQPGELILEAKHIGRRKVVDPLDIRLRKGEVLGFAGLLGSGRSESAGLLFGSPPPDRGEITLDGKTITAKSPNHAIRNRVGLVPEDRKVEGLFPNLSVRENIILALQVRQGPLRRLSRSKQHETAARFIKALRIATPTTETPVSQLSGGNQQKVVLARWLAAQPRVLILDEPTRGIDVGAKAEVEKLMGDLSQQGLAIILIATELEEIAREAHRVIVMRDRKKVAEIEGEEITVDNLMQVIADAR